MKLAPRHVGLLLLSSGEQTDNGNLPDYQATMSIDYCGLKKDWDAFQRYKKDENDLLKCGEETK